MIDIEELERLAKAAPAGTWKEVHRFGSNAMLAIDESSNGKKFVLGPTHNQSGFLEIDFGPGAKEWIEGTSPAAILELAAEVRRLREDLQAAKLLAHANGEMFRAEKAEAEKLRGVRSTLLGACTEAILALAHASQNNPLYQSAYDTVNSAIVVAHKPSD